MKNLFQTIALWGLLATASCDNTKKQDLWITYKNTMLETIQNDPGAKQEVTPLLGQFWYIELSDINKLQVYNTMMSQSQIGSPEIYTIVGKLLLWEEELKKIEPKLWDSRVAEALIELINQTLLQSWVFIEPSTYEILSLDSAKNIFVDENVFKAIFGESFDMPIVQTAYINEPKALIEWTVVGNTVIINTSAMQSSIKTNSLLWHTSPAQYTAAVVNNETVHAYLYKKYGMFSVSQWGILGQMNISWNDIDYSIRNGGEFISDVAAIMTDVSYLSTPLYHSIHSIMSGNLTAGQYKLSQIIVDTIANSTYKDMPEVEEKLLRIIYTWTRLFNQATTPEEQNKVLWLYIWFYLKTFFQFLTPEKEEEIQKTLLFHARIIAKQFEDISNEAKGIVQ